jgi:uncharacterized repeat protein (TIGR03803 family)
MGSDDRRRNRMALVLAFAATIAFAFAPADRASAYTLKVLHRFCAQANCPDGANPVTALVRDDAGNLYGTTTDGGKFGDAAAGTGGTVFELQFTGTGYKYRVLHAFCAQPNCADGEEPYDSLILDANGDLYGTTLSGGAGAGGANNGVAFRLVPDSGHTKWKFEILYTFCSVASCTDGAEPFGNLTYQGAQSGALYDGTSPLFGTAFGGGFHNNGAAFKLASVAGKAKRKESVLYSFCSQKDCDDGQHPEAPLLLDAKGDLFGTAAVGGGYGFGTAFELLPGKNGYTEAVLHDFCTTENDFCPDGQEPRNPLVMDAAGNLFGSSGAGGAAGEGVVFKLTPETYTVKETVLHTFCLQCNDGQSPAPVILDRNGNVLGEASGGGRFGGGTIFKLHGTNFSVLYSFCRKSNCSDGEAPSGGLIVDTAGDLFGTTGVGGNLANLESGGGTVFELTP